MSYGECINPDESLLDKIVNTPGRNFDRQTAEEWKIAVEYNNIDPQRKEELLKSIDDMMCDLEITRKESKLFLSELKSAVEGKKTTDKVKSGEIKIETEKETVGEKAGKPNQGQITKQVGTSQKRENASIESKKDNNPERNNIDKMVAVYEYFENPEVDEFIDIILQKYIGKKVNIDGKIITLSQNNINLYRENFKDYILTTISIESRGTPSIEHDISSASGLGQWLVDSGKSVEVSDIDENGNLKWVTKSKLTPKQNKERLARIEGVFTKPEHRERTIPTRSSYETMLNRVLPKFNEIKAQIPESIQKELLSILPNNIVQARSGETPIGTTLEEQIPLLILDTVTHTLKVENANGKQVGIDDFMKTILVRGNYWEMSKAYAIYHHRKVDKKTEGVFRKNYNEVRGESQNLVAGR